MYINLLHTSLTECRLVAVDESGNPIGVPIVYGVDTQQKEEQELLPETDSNAPGTMPLKCLKVT